MTNQSDRQASVRVVSGTTSTYEGDWHAYWDILEIPKVTFDERMLIWINQSLGTSYTELNGAMAAYAISQGVANWNSLGSFTAPGGANLYFTDNAYENGYYTDSAYANRYVSNGSNNSQINGWKAARASQDAGTKSPKILFIGDSTTFGTGSNGTNVGNLKPLSYPAQLSALLDTASIPSQANSFSGAGNSGSENEGAMDFRFVQGTGWTISSAANVTVGGNFFQNLNAGASGTVSFTPTEFVDTFKVWYFSIPGGGDISIDIDGGTGTPVSLNQSTAVRGPIILTAALGTHTVNITKTGGGNVYLMSIEAYNSAVKEISCINAGYPGSATAIWAQTTNPYSPLTALNYQVQDLTIVCLGINSWRTSESLTTFRNSMRLIIAKAKQQGDTIVMTPAPSAISITPLATQTIYVNILIQIAAEYNCPVIDIFNTWGSYEADTSRYADTLHPNGTGYAQIAQLTYNVIANP